MGSIERTIRGPVRRVRWAIQRPLLSWRHPEALAFYERVLAEGYTPNNSIDLAPRLNILYIANPKVASTRIRTALAALLGRDVVSNWSAAENWQAHKRSATGLKAPRHDIAGFYRLATDPDALRFSFVRNPYDRLASCWVNQYRDKPLVRGRDVYINTYLEHREDVDAALPAGASETLPFPQFVKFALATTGIARPAVEMHWHPQVHILHVPDMTLSLIGKIENFAADFARVLDFVKANDKLRSELVKPLHHSRRAPVSSYYDAGLAARVYRAYQADFDAFRYVRALPA